MSAFELQDDWHGARKLCSKSTAERRIQLKIHVICNSDLPKINIITIYPTATTYNYHILALFFSKTNHVNPSEVIVTKNDLHFHR